MSDGNFDKLTVTGDANIGGNLEVGGQLVSVHYGNRGKIGQAKMFNPDNNLSGLWIEGTCDTESAGLFLNGNTMCLWSPGDNGLLRIYDEDEFDQPQPLPKFLIDRTGNVGIGTTTRLTAKLEINGDVRICDKTLYLRRDGDPFHGIGWYDTFAQGQHINGPVVFGGNGGALGTNNSDGQKISLSWNKSGIQVKGDITATGDVLLLGADCAEDFNILGVGDIEAGTVMVICEDGALRPSDGSYDKRVAGVISGAGDLRPGIVLDKKAENTETQRRPLALVGKVFCKVDASYMPIEVGDLLTTSPTPGHGMKADDPSKAFGTVFGKALHGLESGQGLIPILIALQ